MNLKDFVRQSLLEIMEGVATAQQEWDQKPGSKGVINPIFGSVDDAQNYTKTVKFDVAITATENVEGGAKAGLKVWSVEMGADAARSKSSSTISRVEFEIPINPPAMIVTKVGQG